MKTISELRIEDFEKHPVWRFETGMDDDEENLEPVTDCPVSDLRLCIVGATVHLQNGDTHWAILGNTLSQKELIQLALEE